MKSKLFLALAYFLFLTLSFKTLTGGLKETWNKISVDDHYAWILKNPQLTECFTQDCRFIKDTQQQLVVDFEAYSYDLNYKRWREQHCLFDVYTLLYTAHMSAYKSIFDLPNYETAYECVAYTNFFIVSLCLLLFLAAVFGVSPAALAFLMLCLSKSGWLYFGIMTPSFVITGLTLAAVALYAKKPHLLLRFLPFIIIFISLYHSIGKLYSVALFVLVGVHYSKKIRAADKSVLIQLALSAISLASLFLLGLIEKPQFKLAAFPFLSKSELLDHFGQNLKTLVESFSPYFYFGPLPTLISGLLSIIFIFFLLKWVKKSNQDIGSISMIGFFYLGLSFASLFHLFKNHPGELTARLAIPLFAYLCGLISYLLIQSFTKPGIEPKYKKIFLIAAALFSMPLYFNFMPHNTFFNNPPSFNFLDSKNNFYDPEQVKKIFNANGECGSVLYLDQTPMWFYTTYGALNCGAIIGYVWPDNSKVMVSTMLEHPDLNYFVAFNPIFNRVGLPLLSLSRALQIQFKDPPKTPFQIHFKANTEQTRIIAIKSDGSNKVIESQSLIVEPHQRQNLKFTLEPGQRLQITAPSGVALIEKASFSDALRWPWENKTLFSFMDVNAQGSVLKTIDIDLQAWQKSVETYYKIKVEAFDDSKSTVLMKVSQ